MINCFCSLVRLQRRRRWLLFCFYGPANMTHKLSSARAEMILSYHLLPQQILSRHCFVVVWLFVFCLGCFCLCLFLVLFLLLVLCFSVLVLWNVTRE